MNTDFDRALTEAEEDELIKKHPHKYFRDNAPIASVNTALVGGGEEGCYHLVTPSSGGGVHCVKCGAWFCF